MRSRLLPAYPLLLALGCAASAAPAPSARPVPSSPETRVEGYRVVVEKVHQIQNLALDFGADAAGKVTGSQQIYLELAVFPPSPALSANIQGLDPHISALPGTDPAPSFQSYVPEDAAPAAGGAWRTRLLVSNLDLRVNRLTGMRGEVVVYPRAKLVTLDLPLTAHLPLTREEEGLRATLKALKREQNTLGLSLALEWPETVQISRPNPDAPEGITVLTKSGAPLTLRSQNTAVVRQGGTVAQQYTMAFQNPSETPATARVSVIVRSGSPRKLAFTLPDFPLPDALSGPVEQAEAAAARPVSSDHPLYQEHGGAVRLPAAAAGGTETISLGLSRREAAGFGPWRWVDGLPEADGSVLVEHLRPGRYRVCRGLPGHRTPGTAALEVLIQAGKEARPSSSGGRR